MSTGDRDPWYAYNRAKDEPTYTQDELDAAVAAERERCAKHIDVPYERRGDEFAEALRNMDVPINRALSVDGA